VKEVKKEHTKYKINIQGLSNNSHEFDFEGGEAFFESFEQDIIGKGHFKAHIVLLKSETMMRLNIDIKGNIALVCDRTLRGYEEPLDLHEVFVYNFGDRFEEVAEDMEIIPTEETEINLARNIFEYICLAVPMKKLHPDYRDDDGGLIYSDNFEKKNSSKEEIDPRWAALKNLKKDL
jgi:uncharacterized protein